MSSLTPLETRVLAAFRAGESVNMDDLDEDERWLAFGLRSLLVAGEGVRAAGGGTGTHALKEDGSPHTVLERAMEVTIRRDLAAFAPDASVFGEESGGHMNTVGVTVAIDPIDGTWAFLTQTETYANALNVFRDGEPYLGLISNPATGEIGYALHGGSTRLVRLDVFGEGDKGHDLPQEDPGGEKILVNFHPDRTGRGALDSLLDRWADGDIRMVRSPGGSPSWALLEAARGHYAYVNLWSGDAAEPWDLAAGYLLVRGAGGDVVDFAGRTIEPVGHRGPFVAAVDERKRETLLEALEP